MVKAKLYHQNHTKKCTHTHSQKEKKEKYIYIEICGEFLAFRDVWGLLPAFSRCSVGVVPHVVVFLMYLWGGRWSPCLTPPTSCKSPPDQFFLITTWWKFSNEKMHMCTYTFYILYVIPSNLKKFFIFIYLFLAALGLSNGTGDPLLWHAGFSLVVARGFQRAWAYHCSLQAQ